MKKKLKRAGELVIGGALIGFGATLLVTPLPGAIVIATGVWLISPYHGRRAFWWIKILWKWFKRHVWYRLWHDRIHSSKAWKKMVRLRKKLKK